MSQAFDGHLNRLKPVISDVHSSYRTYADAGVSELLGEWVGWQRYKWPQWLYDDESQVCETNLELLVSRMGHCANSPIDSDDECNGDLPACPRTRIALLRLRFGEMVEEDLCVLWESSASEELRLRYTMISLAAAVWTSTHAEFLVAQLSEHTYLHRATLHLVPSEYTDPELGEFLTSINSINDCGNGSKRTHLVYQLLHRSENTASRGWTSSSSQLLKTKGPNGAGLRDVVAEAMLVALTGLHSSIDPVARPRWRDRLRVHHTFRQQINVTEHITTAPIFIKQITRRLLLSAYAGNDAARTVHNEIRCTDGAFPCPPLNLAPKRCRYLMAIVADKATKNDPSTFFNIIDNSMEFSNQRAWTGLTEWPWNGKAGVYQTPVMLKPIALSMYMDAHYDIFSTFWRVCYTKHMLRVSRLDAMQYDAFCEMNEIMRATCHQEQAVRKALSMPNGHKLPLQRALAMFGHDVEVSMNNYKQVLQEAPRATIASILAYARACALFETKQEYEYPLKILLQQETVVYERYVGSAEGLGRDAIRAALSTLPEHAYKLCVCTECHRIANAHAARNQKNIVPFNEVGIASCITCAQDNTNVRCAKRISAAIRTAISAEQFASTHAIDQYEQTLEDDLEAALVTPLNRVEEGHLRRDARRTYEQLRVSTVCGENALLRINLLGKLVRVYNTWYALCCFCGGLISNVDARTSVNGLPACMRCGDLKKFDKKDKRKTQESDGFFCRFCRYHKNDLVALASPFDDQFDNKDVPQALRVTFWCAKHRPPWLQEALLAGYVDDSKALPMSEIIARIGQHVPPRH